MESFYKERISRFNRNNSRSTSTTPKFTPSRDKVVNKIMEEKAKTNYEKKTNEKIKNLRLSINKSRSRSHSPDFVDKSNNNISRKDTNNKSIPKKSETSNSNLNTNITKVDESAKLLINKLKVEKERLRQNNNKNMNDSKGKFNR